MQTTPTSSRRTLVDRALALPRWLWHELVDIAELFSDAGHGPHRWREGGPIESPFAGSGPDAPAATITEPDEIPPGGGEGR